MLTNYFKLTVYILQMHLIWSQRTVALDWSYLTSLWTDRKISKLGHKRIYEAHAPRLAAPHKIGPSLRMWWSSPSSWWLGRWQSAQIAGRRRPRKYTRRGPHWRDRPSRRNNSRMLLILYIRERWACGCWICSVLCLVLVYPCLWELDKNSC